MNKSHLVAVVATTNDVTTAKAGEIIDAMLAAITEALKSGEEVRLFGFGSFTVTARTASRGRNPRTGESIVIPARKQPKFSAAKALKDVVNS
ncbi:MAG: HU family DNA-binding protein [Ancalomicrobiaceae bacterium]|nr:HU family DNA-binding protein [Ancalomicrobiaceae bacterium]